MTSVFIGGSRHLARLPAGVKQRLDNVIAKRLRVLIGDANGADKAVQTYLAGRQYDRVTVFCMAGGCRNNVGRWATREIPVSDRAKGFQHYAIKDTAMAGEAAFGLMIWDAKSKGTLNNIVNLLERGRPVVVYLGPAKSFAALRGASDLENLLRQCNRPEMERLGRELNIERRLSAAASARIHQPSVLAEL